MSDRSQVETVRIPAPTQMVSGKYRLIEQLGGGGMGLVFLAEQVNLSRKVAVKFLDPEPTTDTDARVQRFLQEARVSLEVMHPGAALLLDFGKDEQRGYLYLVFEYVEGEDLRELLKREWRLPFDEAKAIALRMAEPLAFAHAKGIVHRDVKPENVRVRRDLSGPHVTVLDFGIARLIGKGGVRLTTEGMLAGTPRYMAPEQVRDGPIDARADVYALGLVFFEMLSGQPAFDGLNPSRVMLRQVQEPLPTLESVAPELGSAAVDAFLACACAKDPAERFQSMEELATALRELTIADWPAAAALSRVTAVQRPRPNLEPAPPKTSASLESVTDPNVPEPTTLPPPPAARPDPPVMQTHVGTPLPRTSKPTKALWILIGALTVVALALLWRLR